MTTEAEALRIGDEAAALARQMRALAAGQKRAVVGIAIGMLVKSLVVDDGLAFDRWVVATQALLDSDARPEHVN